MTAQQVSAKVGPLSRDEAVTMIRCRMRKAAGRSLIAIDGVDGAGKTTFANQLAAALLEGGQDVIRISLEDYLNPAEIRHAQGRTSPQGFYADSYDYERFHNEVLEPLGPGGSGRYRTASYDLESESGVVSPWRVASDHAVVIVDGLFLQRDSLRTPSGRSPWTIVVWVECDFDESFRRLAEREGKHPNPLDASNRRYYEGQLLYLAECEPAERADLVVDCGSPEEA